MFLFAVDISIRTHTLVCSRPVKVTKKFVWPCCESLLSPLSLSLSPWFGTESGPSSCSSPILDRTYFIMYPPTPWLHTGSLCLSLILRSKFARSPFPPPYLLSLFAPLDHLYPSSLLVSLPLHLTISTRGARDTPLEALVIPCELNTFSSIG